MVIAPAAVATETDQFTTPREPLRDIGPSLSQKVGEVLESDQMGRDPEEVLAAWAGRNPLSSRTSRWVHAIPEAEGAVRFRPSILGSIYRGVFSPVPITFLFDSPTVNVHGFFVGTDKIDHFFRQGYEYFQVVTKALAEGAERETAIAEAVRVGVRQEHRQLGTLTSGVFSNGDLAANYAGMKFYLNLREPVRIGGRVWPALLERSGGGWKMRDGVDRERLLERFVSNHLDESLNPSRYRFGRGAIRARIRQRCGSWIRFYADRLDLVAAADESFAATWHGEDYGRWLPAEEEVSIATECDGHG